MRYKLRAECTQDVLNFLAKAGLQMYSFKMTRDSELPDVELEFETELTPGTLLLALMQIPDGHVMYETIMPINDYTGIRK